MKQIVFLILFLLQLGHVLAYICTRKVIAPNVFDEGFIYSPSYPNNYPAHACYMWYHVVSTETKVLVEVQDLDMPLTDSCQSNNSNRLIFRSSGGDEFCGFGSIDSRYAAVVSKYFYIVMITRGDVPRGRGFILKYKLSNVNDDDDSSITTSSTRWIPPKSTTTTTVSPFIKPVDRPGHTSSPSCSFSTVESVGTITLPRTVASCGRYKGTITWLLKTPQTSEYSVHSPKFSFRFQSFHLYSGCCTLDIYQGSSEKGLLVSHFYSRYHEEYLRMDGPDVFIKLSYRKEFYQDTFGNFTLGFQRDKVCRFGYTQCLLGEHGCFPNHKKCDGVWDCPLRGGDERGCHTSCPKNKFSCGGSSIYCYMEEDRCNGKGTCANYRDERNCSPSQCSSDKGLFLCKNKRCIYEKWRCDHTNDCKDGSDEVDCDSISSSPRLIMACVVGTTISALLLVLTLSFVCRVYTLRGRQRRGEPEVRNDSPQSRYEEDLLRIRAPPPQYNEAMLTSRSYDEAYLELLNQGRVDLTHDNPTLQDGACNALSTGTGSGGGRSRRNRRRLHRNLRIQQQLQLNPPPHYLSEQPPGYSEEIPPDNRTNEMELHTNDSSHELQPIHSSSTEPVPPPYSLHQDPPSSSGSDDDEDDDDEEDDYIEDFAERDGEESCLLGGSDEEEDDTCLSIGLASESEHSHPLSFTAPTSNTLNPSLVSSDSGQVSEVSLDKDEEDDNDKKGIEAGEEEEEEEDSSHSRPRRGECPQENIVPRCEKEDSRSDCQPNVARVLDDGSDDDCECILSADIDRGEDVYDDDTTSDVACLISA